MSLIKEIEFVIKLQGDTPTVLCSLFEKIVTVNEDNQGAIALAAYPQMRTYIKHIGINYHQLPSNIANGDI